jgi:hypothetical protein
MLEQQYGGVCMKCIKKGSIVIRVKNDKAAALVTEGWKYTDRKSWKAAGRMYK